ncbi:hypothetical protein DICPUDRAFT_33474 [Dictyostelium purpureum]|uniref:NADH:flavin oxidoreductase/NADH oxidase N-terminal domain-containing protein n=1 Tax=Dictyostelium purpureum TaxID=5786 RepID=F0ZKZ1_DICPU|nr:uncharacterized protein DICPUDRAFT_33474 [Dictyostelium purpureum]EGC35402.1 hypothetical protein DICPUDRAFT_33474 [Dictyostelium purpureum]|eukprot:XP_003288078.1 hypothetical protein DICPUDRAFT_33474 [Dictyostelium purpureum]
MSLNEFTYPYDLPNNYKGPGSPIVKPGDESKPIPLTFTPITIKSLTLKNRLVVSPMCQYSSHNGEANDWHLSHYSSYAKGGASLVIFEAAAVQPEGRISYADLGIWSDEFIAPLKRCVDLVHRLGSTAGIQLAHAGRKASSIPPFLEGARNSIPSDQPNGWEVFGPSEIKFNDNMSLPHEMTKEQIKETIEAFKQGALRLLKAGFDMIEIHNAHGYIGNQFISPVSNQRTDEYGGSFENRIRFLLETITEIRSVWPTEKVLAVRLTCDEWLEDGSGWTMNDTIELVKILDTMDVDIIDCSSGGNSTKQKIKVEPLYQVPFADSVKKHTKNLFVATVGLINTGNEIEDILQQNKADIVMLARPFLRNPHFVYQVAKELNQTINYQIQYERGRE